MKQIIRTNWKERSKMMMGMEPVMQMTQRMTCPGCGQVSGDDGKLEHGFDCPYSQRNSVYLRLTELEKKYYDCPECGESRCVDLNEMDFFECRRCRTQFSGSELADCKNPKEACLFRGEEWPKWVFVLERKGEGKFRNNVLIADLKANISRAEKRIQCLDRSR